MDERKILQTAIETFGAENQEIVAIEECSELIQAISHKRRGRKHNIAEEIADVLIVCEQLIIINKCQDAVEKIRKKKIERLFDRIFDKIF